MSSKDLFVLCGFGLCSSQTVSSVIIMFYTSFRSRLAQALGPAFESQSREYTRTLCLSWFAYTTMVVWLGILSYHSGPAMWAVCGSVSLIVSLAFGRALQNHFGFDMETIKWWSRVKKNISQGKVFTEKSGLRQPYEDFGYWLKATIPGSPEEDSHLRAYAETVTKLRKKIVSLRCRPRRILALEVGHRI